MKLKSYQTLGVGLLLVALSVSLLAGSGLGATSPPLPLQVPDPAWRPLSQCQDPELQSKLDQSLKRDRTWQTLISAGKMAVGLVDLTNPARPRYAQVNGDTMMFGASLPKIAILLAAYQGFADGSLKETPQFRAELIEMIRRSDNFATSQVIARIGLGKINKVILDPRYKFYDKAKGGGLWVGGSFRRGGEVSPDPLKNLRLAATVNQVCRFYYLLVYGRLVNPESSRQMLKILAFPDLHDKFVSVLEKEVPPNSLYRKSGEFRISFSDSVLVWAGWRRYILAAMVEDSGGEHILRQIVPMVEQILKPRR